MRNLARAAMLFVALVTTVTTGARSAAAAHGVRLSWYAAPATTMAVGWNSDDPNDHQIQYGTSSAALTMSATAAMISQPAPLNNAFTAELAGLAPGTTYFYRVGGAGGVFLPDAASAPFQFTTHPADPCAPFRFVLIGDNRADTDGVGPNALWADILAEAMAFTPAFFVNTGDMVKNGDAAAEWANFIDASQVGWALVPSILTIGNHDGDQTNGDSAMFNQLYTLPRNSATGQEDYYSLDVGPIHFVSLSSQFNDPGSTDMTTMVTWLEVDLAATTQPWKIVFFHKAVYSRGNHSSGEENGGAINAQLIPVFDAHGVDFVFNGHSHDYERYAPSRGVDTAFGGPGRTFPAGGGASLPAAVPDGATGTTYMVSGGAGALTTDVFGFTCKDAACTLCTGFNINCDGDVFDADKLGTVSYDGRHNFGVFDVDGDTMTVKTYSTVAGNTEPAEIIDMFTMTKTTFGLSCNVMGTPDAGPLPGTPDAAVNPPAIDAGGTIDPPDAGGPGVTGDKAGGCGCETAGGGRPSAPMAMLGLFVLGLLRRRRGETVSAQPHPWLPARCGRRGRP